MSKYASGDFVAFLEDHPAEMIAGDAVKPAEASKVITPEVASPSGSATTSAAHRGRRQLATRSARCAGCSIFWMPVTPTWRVTPDDLHRIKKRLRDAAETYIERAPEFVETPLRVALRGTVN